MKQMTTAEFSRSNLAIFDEPIEVKRYSTVVGTFYPVGSDPVDRMTTDCVVHDPRIVDLEEKVKHLKKLLAAKTVDADGETQRTATRTVLSVAKAIDADQKALEVERRISGLHQQDLDYINRKLGKK